MAHCLSVSSLAGTLSHILHLFTAQLKLYMVQTPYTVYMDHYSSFFSTTGGVDKTTLVHRAINCKCIWANVCVCIRCTSVQIVQTYLCIQCTSVQIVQTYLCIQCTSVQIVQTSGRLSLDWTSTNVSVLPPLNSPDK